MRRRASGVMARMTERAHARMARMMARMHVTLAGMMAHGHGVHHGMRRSVLAVVRAAHVHAGRPRMARRVVHGAAAGGVVRRGKAGRNGPGVHWRHALMAGRHAQSYHPGHDGGRGDQLRQAPEEIGVS